jgi:hypothetical protein
MTIADCELLIFGTPMGTWRPTAERFVAASLGGALNATTEARALSQWHDRVMRQDALAEASGDQSTQPLALSVDAALQELDALLAVEGTPWVALEDRVCWTIDMLAPRLHETQYLVFVQNPVSVLAAALTASSDRSPDEILQIWMAGAERVRRHVQAAPTRCLVVDADEAVRCPLALATVCTERFGREFLALETPAHEEDPVRRALADGLIRGRPVVWATFAELRASSWPLEASADAADQMMDDLSSPLLQQANVRLFALEAAEASLQDLSDRHQELESRLEYATRCLQIAEDEKQALNGRLGEEVQKYQEACTEADKMSSLHQNQLHAANKEIAQLRAGFDQLQRGVFEARQENELLLLELQQAQERLLPERGGTVPQEVGKSSPALPGHPFVFASEVYVESSRDAPPHRELSLRLAAVQLGPRRHADLECRLVEHHGRAGLVIFAAGPQLRPLEVWDQSGTENERSFVLFVPSDPDSVERLQALTQSDWLLVNAIARAVMTQLPRTGGLSPRWPVVAARLVQQFEDLPHVVRYDAVEFVPAGDNEDMDMVLRHVGFGARQIESLRLRWGMGHEGRGGGMVVRLFVSNSAANLPLAYWPLNEDGSWLPSLDLPVGGAQGMSASGGPWSGLSKTDRSFVHSLLQVLPKAASALNGGPVGAVEPARLAIASNRLAADLKRAERSAALRQLARMAFGRRALGS